MESNLKIRLVAPHKISVLLCQASAVMMVLLNVYKETVATFTVQQKCD
jgi:hypothetical protein